MRKRHINPESPVHQRIVDEEKVSEKTDRNGNRWIKVYFGGGAHFRNWLSQFVELKGKNNVKIEGIDSSGFMCCEANSEKLYRIWVKENVGHLDELH